MKKVFEIFQFKALQVNEIFRAGGEWWRKTDICFACLVYLDESGEWVSGRMFKEVDFKDYIAIYPKLCRARN
jgi:hypothetical protein